MNLYYNSVGLPNVPEVIRSPSLDYSLVPMYSIQTAENFRQAAINALTIPNSEYISMFLLAASTGVIISLGVVGAHYVWTQNEDRIFDYASEKLAAAKNGVAALKTNMIRQWKNM
jgi:Na+(H+)/acetate symporter ActP